MGEETTDTTKGVQQKKRQGDGYVCKGVIMMMTMESMLGKERSENVQDTWRTVNKWFDQLMQILMRGWIIPEAGKLGGVGSKLVEFLKI